MALAWRNHVRLARVIRYSTSEACGRGWAFVGWRPVACQTSINFNKDKQEPVDFG